ncbi:family 16 glycosylhydrolase [Formosa sp. Hel1_31_208]|uniref:family 16 glycosylhydrolase n=1 Tax=Formosa sp. Hel1_31_208 TaxID=1798225 RepID=UPI000B8109DC|nr:family 16 glycosylhydrolase [Formosa sp. Hel1_31_208]
MRYFYLLFIVITFQLQAQVVQDDFEGSGTISSWFGDNCGMNLNLVNPVQQGINLSDTVLEYHDTGGQYANVQFDVNTNFDLSANNSFSLKIFIPSNGLTGNQTNQVSLKLQNNTLTDAWTTQSEIIKPVTLNTWQEVTFDFENDMFINLDPTSVIPLQRTDFNRVVIQVNGEDNTDHVLAYIDDVLNFNTVSDNPVYDNLVWSDEFDGVGVIDDTKWFHQTQLIAGDSWANGEQQHYTNRIDNSFMDNGSLKIVAKGEVYSDQGQTKNYTSARLNSKFSFQYGRVEVRAKLPSIAGTWPAIWLLGKNIEEDGTYWDNEGFGTTFWPWCGEIDIMEPNIPKTEILATWHWNNGSGYQYNSSSIPTVNSDTSQNWHIYELEWSPDSMKIYMDNILINQMPTINPFNEEFFILLNVAMGGSLGGDIVNNFDEDMMEIDYVRVYQQSQLSIKDLNANLVSFYPNPVETWLYVEFNSDTSDSGKFQVVDLSGRIISEQTMLVTNNKMSYNTAALDSGMYLMRIVTTDGASSTFKFIKK